MTTKLKLGVGEGWGILSVGRIQLAFDLEIAGVKEITSVKEAFNNIYIIYLSKVSLSAVFRIRIILMRIRIRGSASGMMDPDPVLDPDPDPT